MNKVSRYRKFKGYTQGEMAEMLEIFLQSYSRKELDKVPFSDDEKVFLLNLFIDEFPNLTIDELFFNHKVPKVENIN